ncbi:hypothetical protein CB1_000642048 [Camelus ferus]|nr:hypothetical protein CB1_000642048 [Camelus ferus]
MGTLGLLGGPDPLDYVSMYRNVGSPSANIPEHWHYISFGLSDLYGDNRVHEQLWTGMWGFVGLWKKWLQHHSHEDFWLILVLPAALAGLKLQGA